MIKNLLNLAKENNIELEIRKERENEKVCFGSCCRGNVGNGL